MARRRRLIRPHLVWGVVAAVGGVGALLPAALGLGAMSGGSVLAFVGCLVALPGLAFSISSGVRSRILARLLDGSRVLAHWPLPSAAAAEHAALRLAVEREQGWRLFLVLAILSIAVGIVFVLSDPDGAWAILLASAGVVGLLAILAALLPRLRHARRRSAAQDAIVSLDAAYVAGTLHAWGALGARIEDVAIVPGETLALRVAYSTPLLCERRDASVSIPVPRGEEWRAAEAARALQELRRGSAGSA